jgi:hypothetical protein
MSTERDPGSKLLVECDDHAKYTGKRRPTCDRGKGCIACWQTHNRYLDEHRPKMSRDFKEFYDYICKQKRMLQAGKIDFPTKMSMYEMLKAIEKMIRTGSYRHHLITIDDVLERIDEMERKPRLSKGKLLTS